MLFFVAVFSCKVDDVNKVIDERESFLPAFHLRIKNSSNYNIDKIVFFDGQDISQPKFYLETSESSYIASNESKDVQFWYLEANSYHYARYIKLYLSDISKAVTVDFGFDLSYAIEKRQRTIPENADPIFGFEFLEDFSVKNLYHDKTYSTTINYSSFGKNDELKNQIDTYLNSQKEYDNGLNLSLWEKLGEIVKTGKITVSYGGQVISDFNSADDIIDYFGITLEDGLYSDLFGLLTIAVNEAYASEVYAATDEVEANYIETHELPVAPIRILSSKFSEIATEDDEYIYVNGEAPIKKSNFDNRDLLYYYAGIIPDYHGVKGVVSSSTKLWEISIRE